ncbi:hypothetical protein LA303_08300 [Candidatus Sulfidibacterium hydrothermale]|uniref:hypothetical protein n=1 Tax=Candidatus Sulfidibacterium hydrothermale TaxID=2875962 RepID=UPI001F0B411D|nr:hypothetical protein [Candidatus Sulfidibacterium hydrothermale]UBM61421.1 hypothetical protein LA303_08300 [Candidatus Sulfidibacterium hydrothermale]
MFAPAYFSWKRFQRIFFTLAFLLFLTPFLLAGGLWEPAGARSAGLDRCSTALSDVWSIENNPAGIAGILHFSAAMGFQNSYLSPHLGTADVAVIYPVKSGTFGMNMRYFGYSLYHEMKAGLGYARQLSHNIRLGVRMDYLQTAFGDIYGHHSNFTFALGLQVAISRNTTMGLYLFNPVRVKLTRQSPEKTPALFRFGIAYRFSPNLLTTFEAEKNTNWQPIVIRGGIEYQTQKEFFFRAGIASSGDIFAFGFGWHLKKMQFDLSTTLHQSLGFSPEASLNLSF